MATSTAALESNVGPLASMSYHGENATTAPGSGRLSSLSASAAPVAMLPPAESPAKAIFDG
jgi:hypothetical protein